MKPPIDHDDLHHIFMSWGFHDAMTERHLLWWRSYYERVHVLGQGPTTHYRLFQRILGCQDTTITFRHRNRVWRGAKWVLYVDRRGPQLTVPQSTTFEQATAAFKDFTSKVDEWFDAHPPEATRAAR